MHSAEDYKKIFEKVNESITYDDVESFFKYACLYDLDLFSKIKSKTRTFGSSVISGECPLCIINDILKDYRMFVPSVHDLLTAIANVHETVHAIALESNIGRIYNEEIGNETLPIFYERLFCLYKGYKEIYEKYYSFLLEDGSQDHLNAYYQQDIILEEYQKDNSQFIKKYAKIIKMPI